MRAAGLEPVLISPGQDAIPADFPGLLLMGGSDVNPERYGQTRHSAAEASDTSTSDTSDDARDALECRLIQAALDRDIPLLAICRGLQILNVQHGGTLIQHLDSTARHRKHPANRGETAHQVEVVPDTLLAGIVGRPLTFGVNSRHHQGIDRLGAGLRVSARDPIDGLVEAIERPDKRFVVGVQWHPENMSPSDPRQAGLFQAFAAAVALSRDTLGIEVLVEVR